jgi:hypothetical protein
MGDGSLVNIGLFFHFGFAVTCQRRWSTGTVAPILAIFLPLLFADPLEAAAT